MLKISSLEEEQKITVVKLADICGPCVFGKHSECKRIDCTCDNIAHVVQ